MDWEMKQMGTAVTKVGLPSWGGSLKKACYAERVPCKRCGRIMLRWRRPPELEAAYPFRFDSICACCITPDELRSYWKETQCSGDAPLPSKPTPIGGKA